MMFEEDLYDTEFIFEKKKEYMAEVTFQIIAERIHCFFSRICSTRIYSSNL